MIYHITITVPGNYRDHTCGMCGNFNDQKADDFQLPDGKVAKDVKSFGAAWKVAVSGVVCEDGCSGDLCPKCDATKKKVFEKDCQVLTEPKGPFAACHNVIDPASYFRDCVYDVCMVNGDRAVLCDSISAYMMDCQSFGVKIPIWRTPTFCRKCSIHRPSLFVHVNLSILTSEDTRGSFVYFICIYILCIQPPPALQTATIKSAASLVILHAQTYPASSPVPKNVPRAVRATQVTTLMALAVLAWTNVAAILKGGPTR